MNTTALTVLYDVSRPPCVGVPDLQGARFGDRTSKETPETK